MRGFWVVFLAALVLGQMVWDVWSRREPARATGLWVACEPPAARITAYALTRSGIQPFPVGRGYRLLQIPHEGLQRLEISSFGYLPLEIPKKALLPGRVPQQGVLALTPRWFWVPVLQAPGYWLGALGGLLLGWRTLQQRRRRRRLDESFARGRALPGQEIGPYVVDGILGSGGMARVYEVHLKEDRREQRALKLLHASGGGERFLREARLSLKLRHPHLVAFYDYGEHQGRAYLVMEKVRGETLDRAGLSLPARLACLSQVCEALQVLHDQGIVHRDLKPSNIMVTERKAVLMDFGIARSVHDQQLTLEGQAVGTPGYMAPEQILGQEPQPSADLYALGVVLYEACSGTLPYQAETSFELLSKQLEQEPAPLQGQPAELCQLVMQLLHRDPAARPGPAGHLATRLREWSEFLQSA